METIKTISDYKLGDTVNLKTVQLINDAGQFVTELEADELELIDIETGNVITPVKFYFNPSLGKAIKFVDGADPPGEDYTLIESGFIQDPENPGLYLISYDFEDSVSKLVKIRYKGYDEEEYTSTTLLDYDMLRSLFSVVNTSIPQLLNVKIVENEETGYDEVVFENPFRLEADPIKNILKVNFNNGHGFFAIQAKKIPSQPNKVQAENAIKTLYLKEDIGKTGETGLIKAIVSSKADRISRIPLAAGNLEAELENIKVNLVEEGKTWSTSSTDLSPNKVKVNAFEKEFTYLADTGSPKAVTFSTGDVIRVGNELFKVTGTAGGIGKFQVDRYPSFSNAGATISVSDSAVKSRYEAIDALRRNGDIDKMTDIIPETLEATASTGLIEKKIGTLLREKKTLSESKKIWGKKYKETVIDVLSRLNSQLRLKIDWTKPELIDKEEITEYIVMVYRVEDLTVDNIIDELGEEIETNNFVPDFDTTFSSNIKDKKVVRKISSAPAASFKKFDSVSYSIGGGDDNDEFTISATENFSSEDEGSRLEFLTKSGGEYSTKSVNISEYMNSSTVKVDSDLGELLAGDPTIEKISVKKDTLEYKTVSSDSEEIIDVSYNDELIIFIAPVTEFGIVGEWSHPIDVKVNSMIIEGMGITLEDYVEELRKVEEEEGEEEFIPVKPNSPDLSTAEITHYDEFSVNIDSVTDKDSKTAQLDELIKEKQAVETTIREYEISANKTMIDSSGSVSAINTDVDVKTAKRIIHKLTYEGVGEKRPLSEITEDISALDKDIFEEERAESLRIALTFGEPELKNKEEIVQYLAKVEIINKEHFRTLEEGDDGYVEGEETIVRTTSGTNTKGVVSLSDPDDPTSSLRLNSTFLTTPVRKRNKLNPEIGEYEYTSSSHIRKFDFPAKANLMYSISVASVTEAGLQSDWSDPITYCIEDESTILTDRKRRYDAVLEAKIQKATFKQQVLIENLMSEVEKLYNRIETAQSIQFGAETSGDIPYIESFNAQFGQGESGEYDTWGFEAVIKGDLSKASTLAITAYVSKSDESGFVYSKTKWKTVALIPITDAQSLIELSANWVMVFDAALPHATYEVEDTEGTIVNVVNDLEQFNRIYALGELNPLDELDYFDSLSDTDADGYPNIVEGESTSKLTLSDASSNIQFQASLIPVGGTRPHTDVQIINDGESAAL